MVFKYQKQVPFKSCNRRSDTACAYVDFAIARPWGYVLLECDEDQHRSYDPGCDVRKDFDIAASVALGNGHKLRVARYNPDAYWVDGQTRVESRRERMKRLLVLLDEELAASFERVFLCYDATNDSVLPQVAASWGVVAKAVSRVL